MEFLNEDEDYEPLAPSPFSFFGLATDVCNAIAQTCEVIGELFGATAVNFARAHNRAVDRADRIADGEKFAADIMSGLESL